jgi:hypothetical protein
VGPDQGRFLVGNTKIFSAFFGGQDRMGPAVEGPHFFRGVPIVEKKIVEQRSPDQAFYIRYFKKSAQGKTQLCHIHAVFVHRNPAVLYVPLCPGKNSVPKNWGGYFSKRFSVLHCSPSTGFGIPLILFFI